MITKIDKNAERKRRHVRVRKSVTGTDDTKGVTLASASTLEKSVKAEIAGKTKREAAKVVGKLAAERAKEKGIETVVFDRGGYLYTGRVQSLADGAREAGLKF